ncbi:MAG: Hpt domain-containing protein [Lachnospiraceae bacterium]|nr:Hpt domain-containing protein [Lachnospiraceae bacterium]
MSKLTEELRTMGCDMDGALNRFLQDEEFYAECYAQVMSDPSFDQLKSALDAGDVEEAFHCAHTLKGVIANMGLTPLLNIVVDLVEPLRAGKLDGMQEKYAALLAERKKYEALL